MAGTILAFAGGLAAWAASLFSGLQSPLGLQKPDTVAQLGPLLSPDANILLPGSRGYEFGTDRWNPWKAPKFDVVIEVATEIDVEQAVRYSNQQNKPFLAVSGGHGGTMALADVENGVGIWLHRLKDVEIATDGKSARIGGGITSGELVSKLWTEGKQSVVGACECTGAVGPMLGGGHGWLQGRHGLMADNLISARVVLANGTAVTVSGIEHEDLFWALRGAGHNFGIVTSFEYKVYDRTPENEKWTYEMMIFSEDKLEELYALANTMISSPENSQPVELVHWSMMMRMPDFDAQKPIIAFFLMYQGTSIPPEYREPVLSIGPLFHTGETTTLPGLAKPFLLSNDSPACVHGPSYQRFPVDLHTYSIPALRKAYDILATVPPALNTSFLIFEAYSTHSVKAIFESSTAFPDRRPNLLTAPAIVYQPGSIADEEAGEYGKLMREALVEGSGRPLNAYVNYAAGEEGLGAVYGYDSWRLEKLRRLKTEYDPEGRFNFYNPIR